LSRGKVLLKMAIISTVLLLLSGLCLCQANVMTLTNDNFDSVSFISDILIKEIPR